MKKEDRGHIALELVALDRLISALEGEASTPDQVLAARQLRDALMDLRDKACLLQGSD